MSEQPLNQYVHLCKGKCERLERVTFGDWYRYCRVCDRGISVWEIINGFCPCCRHRTRNPKLKTRPPIIEKRKRERSEFLLNAIGDRFPNSYRYWERHAPRCYIVKSRKEVNERIRRWSHKVAPMGFGVSS